jgi:serine/threonine protein kinase
LSGECSICGLALDAQEPGQHVLVHCNEVTLINREPPIHLRNIRYTDLCYLGEGFNAIVISGYDSMLERSVALKLPKAKTRDMESFELQSARKVAGIDHPNVVPIFHVDTLSGSDGTEYPVTVMKLIDGVPLSSISAERFNLGEYDAVSVFYGIVDTLRHCHERGHSHGDLVSLENILITRRSEPYLIDFGISRRTSTPDIAFDLRSADLLAVVLVASHLFGLDRDQVSDPGEDIDVVVGKIERSLRAGWARTHYSYSPAKRIEFVKATRSAAARYRLLSYRGVYVVRSVGGVAISIEMEMEPFSPFTDLNFGILTDHDVSFEECEVTASISQSGAEAVPVQVHLSSKRDSPSGTIWMIKLGMPFPISSRSLLVLRRRQPKGLDPSKDGHSLDAWTFCNVAELEFRFPDTELPMHWHAEVSQYGEGFNSIEDDSWLRLETQNQRALCTFRDLFPLQSINIEYQVEGEERANTVGRADG